MQDILFGDLLYVIPHDENIAVYLGDNSLDTSTWKKQASDVLDNIPKTQLEYLKRFSVIKILGYGQNCLQIILVK